MDVEGKKREKYKERETHRDIVRKTVIADF
jgi:hypothetical protein